MTQYDHQIHHLFASPTSPTVHFTSPKQRTGGLVSGLAYAESCSFVYGWYTVIKMLELMQYPDPPSFAI